VATLRQRALIIVSASESVGIADYHRGYGFLGIIRANPQHRENPRLADG
jgi:hypothetical protein